MANKHKQEQLLHMKPWRDPSHLTMLVQALANIMYLGLNWSVVIGPGCFPSSTATFIPLSVLQTWILPSSEPAQQDTFEQRAHRNKAKHKAGVLGLTDHDKLRVRSEAGLQGDTFTVIVALKISKDGKNSCFKVILLL